MDNLIDISFIIPCHNIERYIKPLLYSFASLNLENINAEFIFVLDDCTDDTIGQIYHYMNDNLSYKILACKHHCCGFSRNEGLKIAQGKYIWFVDGDDWIIYPNVLQDVLKLLTETGKKICQLQYISNYFSIYSPVMVWQYIYERDIIGDTRFTNIQPHEDVVFNKEVFDKLPEGEDIIRYNIPTYFYNYKRPGSNMQQYLETGEIIP